MTKNVRLSDLANSTPAERNAHLTNLVDAAKHDGKDGAATVQARIHQFELRYEMTSDEMRQKFRNGSMKETAEIAEWLFLLELWGNGDTR